MDNFKYDNDAVIENDWQNISDPIIKNEDSDTAPDNISADNSHLRKSHAKHPVLTFQLIISLCVLLFLFIVKFMGTPLYDAVMSWYETKMSESVIYDGDFENFDFSFLLATDDEG